MSIRWRSQRNFALVFRLGSERNKVIERGNRIKILWPKKTSQMINRTQFGVRDLQFDS